MTVSRGRLSCRMQLSLVLRLCAVATCLATLSSGLAARGSQADDDTLETARDLYAGAAYQDALTTLERLAQRATASDRERATIDHYRALCLLALNRPADAGAAVEAMVRHDPLYSPPLDDFSPRTRQLFQEVERRVLPLVAQEAYAGAKRAYAEGHAEDAVRQFDRVIAILDAVDVAGNGPPLMADLRMLATGFRELASAAAAPASAPRPAEPSVPTPQPETVEREAAPSAATQAGAQGGSTGSPPAAAPKTEVVVTPPVTIRQDVPQWPRDLPLPNPAVAVLEIVISPDGHVQQARLQKAIHPRYDQLLLASTRNWTYRPALRDGQPTPFVKNVRIELSPQQ